MPRSTTTGQLTLQNRVRISAALKTALFVVGVTGAAIALALTTGGKRVSLPVMPTLDQVAQRYAPLWYQDIDGTHIQADYITRVNYDNNWRMADNWENLPLYPYNAAIYWSGVETETHWFIIFAAYHPRDWSEVCTTAVCHENDFEGVQLAIRKDTTTYGRIEVAETIFHNEIHKFYDPSRATPRPGVPSTFAGIPIDSDGRPRVFMESKGHGLTMQMTTLNPGYVFPGGDGIVYRHDGVAAEPEIADGHFPYSPVSYELAPIQHLLWARRGDVNDGNTFDGEDIFTGARFRTGDIIGMAFDGDNYGQNDLAKPTWGWDDALTSVGRGDWAIDPAYTFQEHFTFSLPVSTTYLDNFYLRDLGSNVFIDANTAAQHFTVQSVGPTGTNIDCENNNYNKWCIEGAGGTPHWAPNMIGCYEIADDSGSQDCHFNTLHANTIRYDWTGPEVRETAIDAILIRTSTFGNTCAHLYGYENDGDGWGYGNGLLTQALYPGSWMAQTCSSGGAYGPYQWRAIFTNGVLDAFEVLAGDHHDEGAFRVTDVTFDYKSTCADGTIEGQCSSQRPYQCINGILTAACGVCGCTGGTACATNGVCVVPNKKSQELTPL